MTDWLDGCNPEMNSPFRLTYCCGGPSGRLSLLCWLPSLGHRKNSGSKITITIWAVSKVFGNRYFCSLGHHDPDAPSSSSLSHSLSIPFCLHSSVPPCSPLLVFDAATAQFKRARSHTQHAHMHTRGVNERRLRTRMEGVADRVANATIMALTLSVVDLLYCLCGNP